MARRHFGPLTESLSHSPTCCHIPADHTYGHWYPKYIIFLVKSPKFYIFHDLGCVNPNVWQASCPFAPRHLALLVVYFSKIASELMWSWSHLFTIWQIIINMSIFNNDYVIWILHMNENLYINLSSMLSVCQLRMCSIDLHDSRWLESSHIQSPHLIQIQMKFMSNALKLFFSYGKIILWGLMILVQVSLW